MPPENDRYMQIMKTALPYLSSDMKNFFLAYLKMEQVMQTLQNFEEEQEELFSGCSLSEECRGEELLNAIREFFTPKEQELADMILNIMQISKLWKEMENLEKEENS